MKKVWLSVLTVLSVLFLAACGGSKDKDAAETSNESKGGLPAMTEKEASDIEYKDGKYRATFDRTDVRDWKAFVELTVKDGKITEAVYDYTNDAGEIRSENKKYEEAFAAVNKFTPKEAFTRLSDELVATQDAERIDVVSGATHSTRNFETLAKAATANAKDGKTEEAIVPLYQDGTYKLVASEFSDKGWKEFVELTITDHKIAAVTFDAVNKEGKLKSEDAEYKKAMEKETKTSPEKYNKELVDALIKSQKVSGIDVVSGATHSTDSFKHYVEVLLDDYAEIGKTGEFEAPAE
ncbi:FMN-binding protein [Atopobacter phocae]|uniref:FMN-binding protein n=1 Tax=Atopobacter phocae TaxID=136492 RepID=UPI00046EC930|nr:FMN-binding protein [Atopobacter phocae]